jgi:hypothetical protein
MPKKIKLTEEIKKRLSRLGYYDREIFISDAKTYLKALNSGRLRYYVKSVSKSGMSRKLDITSYEGIMSKGHYRQYLRFFETLGFVINNEDTITVKGTGTNMLFHTNYTVVGMLKEMGFISNKQARYLRQKIN